MPRTNAERVAIRRLEAALVEQARLGDAFARLAGSQAEQAAYLRLQAASLRVSRCDLVVKAMSRQMPGGRASAVTAGIDA
jgi:hypothetical protein